MKRMIAVSVALLLLTSQALATPPGSDAADKSAGLTTKGNGTWVVRAVPFDYPGTYHLIVAVNTIEVVNEVVTPLVDAYVDTPLVGIRTGDVISASLESTSGDFDLELYDEEGSLVGASYEDPLPAAPEDFVNEISLINDVTDTCGVSDRGMAGMFAVFAPLACAFAVLRRKPRLVVG